MILAGGWGDRTVFFEWAVGHPSCHPFLAEIDGRIVGTGVATANGPVGWVGTIFVAPEQRGRGIGAALTRAVIDDLERRGCRTLVLIATDEGRPVYERQGVRRPDPVRPVRGADRARRPTSTSASVRSSAADLAASSRSTARRPARTVRRSSGRSPSPRPSRIAARPDGSVGGFLVRSPWGGKALIAPDPDDALRLLDWRRHRAAPDRRIEIAVLEANGPGRDRLGRGRLGGAARRHANDPRRAPRSGDPRRSGVSSTARSAEGWDRDRRDTAR